MRIAWPALLACLLPWQGMGSDAAIAAPACRVSVQAVRALPGRVDLLLAPQAGGPIAALVGRAGSQLRFLPHDTLDLVQGPSRGLRSIPIPLYLAPPGLAADPGGKLLYALVDSTLLTIDATTGRLAARQDLQLQAIGWPAAIAAGSGGDLYLIGQPAGVMEAQAFAFRPDPHRVLRLRWRSPLGLTHAGAWIGPAGGDRLAVYMPDPHDVPGQVVLLDSGRGLPGRSYAVTAPPLAAAPNLDRLYLAGAGSIQAVTLDAGTPVAGVAGEAPLAAGLTGMVALVRAGRLVLARGDSLATLATLAFPAGLPPTALAWQGADLLVGTARGIARLRPVDCAGHAPAGQRGRAGRDIARRAGHAPAVRSSGVR